MSKKYKPDTLGVRAGTARSDFQEHSEALVLSTSFVYGSAAEAARKFASTGPEDNIYSRFTNPTVRMFQDRLAALEGAEACVATSTGMAAITTMVLGLLKAGDHMVTARGVFGTVVPLRWVPVRDPAGQFATQALLCTDQATAPAQVLAWFVLRRHLGVETQRQWSDQAIRRTTPALLGLFSLVTLLAHRHMTDPAGATRQAAG